MKKLMIAAAIVCAAVVSQGATVSWYWNGTLNNGYLNSGSSSATYDGKAGQPGTVYFINGAEYSQATVLAALVAGDSTLADFAIDSYTTADGKMASTARKSLGEHTDFSPLDANNKGIGYLAMLVNYDGKDYVYLSDNNSPAVISTTQESKLVPSPGTSSSKFYGEASKGYSSAGWYSMVPEPTSGLLLLIGVGALALRRRRA